MNYDPQLSNLILVWIGGAAAVQGLTEKLKWLYRNADSRLKKILNYITSILVSLVVTGLFLFLTDMFSVKGMFLYALPVWLVASGIYDAIHAPKSK